MVCPGKTPHRQPRKGCVEISTYWKHWPCFFPQHGPGRKHNRPIALAPWQHSIVIDHAEALIRGLIHSDGCRIEVKDRGSLSVRYHFSNRSEDIKSIFCQALDLLDIRWTRPCARQIAVYRKSATRRLDEFVGAKV